MNLYSHVAPQVSREAAARMESALWSDQTDADDDPDDPQEGKINPVA